MKEENSFLFVAIIPKSQVDSAVFMLIRTGLLIPLFSYLFVFMYMYNNMAFIISYCIDRNSLVKNPINKI